MPDFSLVIDTAFESCQVGLWQGDTCVTMASVAGGGKHDIVLAPLVQEIFKVHQVVLADLERIIVTTGPGRFTGLRVGIAFARGLALVNGTPLVGVLTTDALYWQLARAYPGRHDMAVMVAVKRGESFLQRPGQPIERVMDADLLDYFDRDTETGLVGMISPEAAVLLDGQTHIRPDPAITEPSLEAIYAVAQGLKASESAVIRPYYAL